jgi:hypothetical protein
MSAFKIGFIQLVVIAIRADAKVCITIYGGDFYITGMVVDGCQHNDITQGAFLEITVTGVYTENGQRPVFRPELFMNHTPDAKDNAADEKQAAKGNPPGTFSAARPLGWPTVHWLG